MSNQNVTWFQISKWWPIILGCITITVSYAALITRIEILDTKVSLLTKIVENYQEHQTNVVNNLNDLNKRLAIVETEHNILKIK